MNVEKADKADLQGNDSLRVESEHTCPHCSKNFPDSRALYLHIRCHGEKKHICKDCGKGFTQVCHLKRHLRIHTGKLHHYLRLSDPFQTCARLCVGILIVRNKKPYFLKYCNMENE